MTNARITPVILSGGAGTRLWPLSRASRPKQFLPLTGDRSTFEGTLARIADADVFTPPIIVSGQDFKYLVADELYRAGTAGEIILEPLRRDSAAAIATAAYLTSRTNPAALLLVLAADHLIEDAEAFVKTVLAGKTAAEDGSIVSFGIKPDKPSTAYGYIVPGPATGSAARKVNRFVEKPDEPRAREMIAAGCLWNSGNFLCRADVLLAELQRFEPAIAAAASAAIAKAKQEHTANMQWHLLDETEFARSPAKSIDYAVMEKTDRAVVIPATYKWSDLGSWDSLWEASAKDDAGNVIQGPVTLAGASNSFISSSGVKTAVVGLSDITVIVTDDIVLVGPRQMAAELKPLAAQFEEAEEQDTATGSRPAAGKAT